MYVPVTWYRIVLYFCSFHFLAVAMSVVTFDRAPAKSFSPKKFVSCWPKGFDCFVSFPRITSETIVVFVCSRRSKRSLVEKERRSRRFTYTEYRTATASRTAISFIDGDVSGKNENCRGEREMHVLGNVNRRCRCALATMRWLGPRIQCDFNSRLSSWTQLEAKMRLSGVLHFEFYVVLLELENVTTEG